MCMPAPADGSATHGHAVPRHTESGAPYPPRGFRCAARHGSGAGLRSRARRRVVRSAFRSLLHASHTRRRFGTTRAQRSQSRTLSVFRRRTARHSSHRAPPGTAAASQKTHRPAALRARRRAARRFSLRRLYAARTFGSEGTRLRPQARPTAPREDGPAAPSEATARRCRGVAVQASDGHDGALPHDGSSAGHGD